MAGDGKNIMLTRHQILLTGIKGNVWSQYGEYIFGSLGDWRGKWERRPHVKPIMFRHLVGSICVSTPPHRLWENNFNFGSNASIIFFLHEIMWESYKSRMSDIGRGHHVKRGLCLVENQLCDKIQPCSRWNEYMNTLCKARTISENVFIAHVLRIPSYRSFARQPCCMAGTIDSFWEKIFFLMQNIFIVPAMQHGCCAIPL